HRKWWRHPPVIVRRPGNCAAWAAIELNIIPVRDRAKEVIICELVIICITYVEATIVIRSTNRAAVHIVIVHVCTTTVGLIARDLVSVIGAGSNILDVISRLFKRGATGDAVSQSAVNPIVIIERPAGLVEADGT